MKTKAIYIQILLLVLLQSCITLNTNGTIKQSETKEKPVSKPKPTVILSGSISHDKYESGASASCQFMEIPKTYEDFLQMYQKAAVEPQGAAAMFILALELYKNDINLGKRCMNHCIYGGNSSSKSIPSYQMKIIKDKLLGTDNYAQPYISKAFYEGATPANKYTPEKYKINFYVKPSDRYSPLSSAQSYVIPLKVKAYGYNWNNNPNRDHNMEVIKPAGENYYVVYGFMDLFNGVLPPNK